MVGAAMASDNVDVYFKTIDGDEIEEPSTWFVSSLP
jgi:hypothetical protein